MSEKRITLSLLSITAFSLLASGMFAYAQQNPTGYYPGWEKMSVNQDGSTTALKMDGVVREGDNVIYYVMSEYPQDVNGGEIKAGDKFLVEIMGSCKRRTLREKRYIVKDKEWRTKFDEPGDNKEWTVRKGTNEEALLDHVCEYAMSDRYSKNTLLFTTRLGDVKLYLDQNIRRKDNHSFMIRTSMPFDKDEIATLSDGKQVEIRNFQDEVFVDCLRWDYTFLSHTIFTKDGERIKGDVENTPIVPKEGSLMGRIMNFVCHKDYSGIGAPL